MLVKQLTVAIGFHNREKQYNGYRQLSGYHHSNSYRFRPTWGWV